MKRIRRLPLGVGGILGRLGLYPLSAHSTPTWVGGDPAPRNNRALHSHRGGGVQGARPPTGKGGNAAKSRKALFAKRVGKREVSIVASVSCRHRCEGAARVKGLTGATMPDKQPAPHGQDLGGWCSTRRGRVRCRVYARMPRLPREPRLHGPAAPTVYVHPRDKTHSAAF